MVIVVVMVEGWNGGWDGGTKVVVVPVVWERLHNTTGIIA